MADSCLTDMAVGLENEMATVGTCADAPTIEMVANRHEFRAGIMPAPWLSSTNQCTALFLTQEHDLVSDPQKRTITSLTLEHEPCVG